jgi:nucleotidyltransferase/DNA polymerase involved in DNA repair
LIERKHDIARWERGFGAAELIVEQTEVIPQYCSTRYEYAVRYREIDACREAVDIVSSVPRRQAFEIGVHVLRSLDQPVSECSEQQHALEEVKGVGPAKSRKLLLLGINTPKAVARHISRDASSRLSGDEPLINRHHAEAVDKVLTSTIRESASVSGGTNVESGGGN